MDIRTHLQAPAGIFATLLLAASAIIGTTVQAAAIAIENPSFEATPRSDGSFTFVAPPGWTQFNGGTAGTFNPTSGELASPTDGLNVVYLNAPAGIRQTLTTNVTAGSYTLTADFAYRLDRCCGTPSFTMDLLGGSNVLASFLGNPGDFSTTSFKTAVLNVNVPGGASDIGSALGIRIVIIGASGGEQVNIDNVTLNFAPNAVPLPASGWMLLPAMAGVAGLTRRKARG